MAKRTAKPRVPQHVVVDSLSLQNKNGEIVAVLRTNETTGLAEFVMLDGGAPRIFIGFDEHGAARIEVMCAEGCHRAGMSASETDGARFKVSTDVADRQVGVEMRDTGLVRTCTIPASGGMSTTTVEHSVLVDAGPHCRQMDHPLPNSGEH